MTDTHDAVRLAVLCDSGEILGDEYDAIASILRRFPELEADVQEQARLNGMGAERELALMARVAELEAERDQLSAIAEGRASGCQCGDDDVCKIVRERDQLRAELDARWQPIETAPKWQSVLLWVTRGGGRCVIDDWGDYDRHNHPRITHWMPLPAAPTPPNADQKGQ